MKSSFSRTGPPEPWGLINLSVALLSHVLHVDNLLLPNKSRASPACSHRSSSQGCQNSCNTTAEAETWRFCSLSPIIWMSNYTDPLSKGSCWWASDHNVTGQTDTLSNSGKVTTHSRWAGPKSQVAGKEVGQHFQGRGKLKLSKKTRTKTLRRIGYHTTAAKC